MKYNPIEVALVMAIAVALAYGFGLAISSIIEILL